MINIFSFELKRLIGRLSTYIYTALILLCEGYFITNINLYGGSPAIETTIDLLSLPLMACIPLLTFLSFAGDSKTGFDSVIYSLGLSNIKLLLGKFFAAFTVFLASTLPVIIAPLVLSAFAKINLLSAFISILGYLLFGAAMISLGLFVSSVSTKPLYSALFTYTACGIMYACEWLELYSSNITAVFFALTVISLLISLAFMKITRHDYAWLIPLAVFESFILILRFSFPKALCKFGDILFTFIGARYSVSGFCYGLFNIASAFNLMIFGAMMLSLGFVALSSKKQLSVR